MTQRTIRATGNGSIVFPERCSSNLGEGGNYREDSLTLAGKKEGAGKVPAVRAAQNLKHICFTTDPEVKYSGNDRSELAYMPMIKLNSTINLDFEIRIPKKSPIHKIGNMCYLMQLWQCSPFPPIAGIRIKEGTSHGIDFAIRRNRDAILVEGERILTPGAWHRFKVVLRPSLNSSGFFNITIDDVAVASYSGPIGVASTICANPSCRVKFGLYKTNSPGDRFEVNYRNLVMRLPA